MTSSPQVRIRASGTCCYYSPQPSPNTWITRALRSSPAPWANVGRGPWLTLADVMCRPAAIFFTEFNALVNKRTAWWELIVRTSFLLKLCLNLFVSSEMRIDHHLGLRLRRVTQKMRCTRFWACLDPRDYF